MTNINFKNKTVVITGGSRGIGLEITKTFLKHQANVIILARNKPNHKIQSKGNASYFIECDVRDVDSIDSAVKLIASKYKSIDVLINNAGGAPMIEALTASPKFHEAIIDLNLTAPLNLSQKIAKKMVKQKTVSNIINIS
ncbi:SDR family NAD(P)-dependent oxidoreductase, partial [Gammaproteobacteria bacterium]|nr:SDR family NAD(P)-dependent oxidoreductase [Gammaproteobacteria bacterium]